MIALKATGSQGSWYTLIEGKLLPCAWQRWLTKHDYHDPGALPQKVRWQRYFSAIKAEGKVALAQQYVTPDGKWHRNGYIALLAVDDVMMDETGLRFRYVDRLADLK